MGVAVITFDLNPEDLTPLGRAKVRALFMHYYPDADWDYLEIEWDGPVLTCDITSMPVPDFPKKPEPKAKRQRWWVLS